VREARRTFSLQAAVVFFALVATSLPAGAAAFEVPSPHEIFQRVFAMSARVPAAISADAVVKFRVKKSVSDPPDCVFKGIARVDKGHQIVEVTEGAPGTLCWVAKLALGQGFDVRKDLAEVIPLLDLTVLGLKLAGHDHYYLIEGKAREPKMQLRELIVWVDYERGLLTEGTLVYTWGSLDVSQEYMQLDGAWVVTRQYIYTSRFDASLEVSYRNYRVVDPKVYPASRTPSSSR
jgi:hypothetical protein